MKEPLPPEILLLYQLIGKTSFFAHQLLSAAEKRHHILWYINHKYITITQRGQPAKYTLTAKTISACQYQLHLLSLPQLKAQGLTIAEISRITNTSQNTVQAILNADADK